MDLGAFRDKGSFGVRRDEHPTGMICFSLHFMPFVVYEPNRVLMFIHCWLTFSQMLKLGCSKSRELRFPAEVSDD